MKRYIKLLKRLIILVVILGIFKFGFNNVNLVNSPNDIMVLVNYKNHLAKDYVPYDLVVPNIEFTFNEESQKRQMRKPAAQAIERMFDEARNQGIYLYGVSGYRSAERQKQIYDNEVHALGELKAKQYVALPGESEHQTGLAMDIGKIDGKFGDSKEGKWVSQNAHKYGFILRYPAGKENITKINYEPWHFRYVGIKPATEIYNKGLTLEEYSKESPIYNDILSIIAKIPRKLLGNIINILNMMKATGIITINTFN